MEFVNLHFTSGQVLSLEHLDHAAMDNLFRNFIYSKYKDSKPLHIHEYMISLDKIEYITFPKSFVPTKD